ncbi:MAG TPA: SUMF1/EgtB/PvdO family nonheme iron enzyme [archaeon]|nr:SUMF1/EgtB/PvdO family nonheme iron enzyme [archaeon]
MLLSIQDFEALGVEESLARSVSDLLRAELARSARLRLLEETGRLYRLQRESARLRDLFEEKSLRHLGELLESRYVLTGSVSRLDTLIVVSARVVDAETGEVLASEVVQHAGSLGRLGESIKDLSRRVLAHFPLTGKIVKVRGDTLVADIGLADGLLPGQELTVADLGDGRAESWGQPSLSVRCRVVYADDRTSRLVPSIPGKAWPLGAGSTVLGIDTARELARTLEKETKTGPSALEKAEENFGSVLIESEPSGALTVLSGLDVGRTPVKGAHLSAGRHPLYLDLPGYLEVSDSITVVPGTLKKYSYELVRQTGRLTIFTVQPDITVRIDTLEFPVGGTGSITLEEFPAGTHRLEARKKGYETYRETVEIDFRQDSTIRINLVPHPGSLLLNSVPTGARIFIDGIFTGKSTPWRLTHLTAGIHVVLLSIRDYGVAQDTVEVLPGEDLTLEPELRPGWFDYTPVGMALIPRGERFKSQGDIVLVDSFYIDIHEVTNRAYAYFVSATGYKPPPHWLKGAPPDGEEDHPVVNVSYEDAARFAAWCGKRLPTEVEWERAAMGEEFRKYPWGNSFQPGAANTWSEGLGRTVPVGSYPSDKNSFGLYDLAGNVSEWVDSWLDGRKMYRVYRGGSYYVNDTDPSMASRDGLYPISKNKYIGFRCARDLKVRW